MKQVKVTLILFIILTWNTGMISTAKPTMVVSADKTNALAPHGDLLFAIAAIFSLSGYLIISNPHPKHGIN